ncbi:MAG TPA: peptidoglycan editing factor PgeF [Pyrinomonadaceae bacterium]
MDTITDQLRDVQRSAAEDKTLADSGFYWRERGGVKVLVCRALEDAGFANGFSTRLGGVSSLNGSESGTELNLSGFSEDTAENIYENRRRFLAIFDRPYQFATVWQVHGDGVKVVRDENGVSESNEKYDALVSDLPNTLVGVKTADCVPVLIGDPRTGAYAAVHAGWRGTAQSIVQKAVAKLGAVFGSRAEDLVCAIGPAAGCEQYEVGPEVIDTFAENFASGRKYFVETRPGHALVDLKQANRDRLTGAGVSAANIFTVPLCTMTRSDLFFSYRIEKKKFGRTGRLLSVIGRK